MEDASRLDFEAVNENNKRSTAAMVERHGKKSRNDEKGHHVHQQQPPRTISAASVSAANFHLNTDILPVLSTVLGFAAGGDGDYLNVILVCQEWKRVADEESLKDLAVLQLMESKCQLITSLKPRDIRLLQIVLDALKSRKSPFYKRQAVRAATDAPLLHVEKWPRLEFRAHATLCAFVCELLQVKCEKGFHSHKNTLAVHGAIYDMMEPVYESVATRVVEKMQASSEQSHDHQGTTPASSSLNSSDIVMLRTILDEWQRWKGMIKIIKSLSRYLGRCRSFTVQRPTLDVVAHSVMGTRMKLSMNPATRDKVINLIDKTTVEAKKNNNALRLPLADLQEMLAILQPKPYVEEEVED